ncbi:MAG: 50S ribosomal protein L21 [Candidatus Margulisbacteria bacterium]|nr:50S ribosomal protein L21 [Candidatus Margulisiibacteriota bacterium]
MYAIVEVSGKQYKVEKGMKLYVDRLGEKDKAKLVLDKVLFVNDGKVISVGTPYVEGYVVKAEVIDPEFKDKKVIVFKYKNKTGYHKKQGHRQQYTILNIKDIAKADSKPVKEKVEVVAADVAPVVKKPAVKKTVKASAPVEKKPVKKTTAKKAE